jgi:hypothetical protein
MLDQELYILFINIARSSRYSAVRSHGRSLHVRSRPKEFSAWECYEMKSGVSITTTSVPTRGSAGRPQHLSCGNGGPLRYA